MCVPHGLSASKVENTSRPHQTLGQTGNAARPLSAHTTSTRQSPWVTTKTESAPSVRRARVVNLKLQNVTRRTTQSVARVRRAATTNTLASAVAAPISYVYLEANVAKVLTAAAPSAFHSRTVLLDPDPTCWRPRTVIGFAGHAKRATSAPFLNPTSASRGALVALEPILCEPGRIVGTAFATAADLVALDRSGHQQRTSSLVTILSSSARPDRSWLTRLRTPTQCVVPGGLALQDHIWWQMGHQPPTVSVVNASRVWGSLLPRIVISAKL